MRRLNKKIVRVIRYKNDNDDGYVNAAPEDRFSMVWDITCDMWAFGGKIDVEQRLQRNVTNIIKQQLKFNHGNTRKINI